MSIKQELPRRASVSANGNHKPMKTLLKTPIRPKNYLSPLGEKIFLDRYAWKDGSKKSLAVGDTVIVCVDEKTRQREIATVETLDRDEMKAVVRLRDDSTKTVAIEHIDKPFETTPEQTMARIARGIAAVEKTDKQAEWQKNFEWLLEDWKFVPGGRIWAGAGTDQELTFYNCYVIPSPHDSRGGIVKTLQQMMEIMSRGGGVGINVSSLRPRYGYVKGVNGRSSGAVSWGGLYSFVTGLIEQGGCLTPDTLVFTEKGLLRLDEIVTHEEKGWDEHLLRVPTDESWRTSRAVYNNGIADILEVQTEQGLTLRGTPNHKVKVKQADTSIAWKRLDELNETDSILWMLNTYQGGSEYAQLNSGETLTEDIALVWGRTLAMGETPFTWSNNLLPHALRVSPRSVVEAFANGVLEDADTVALPTVELAQEVAILLMGIGRTVKIAAHSLIAEPVYAMATVGYAVETTSILTTSVVSVTPAGKSLTLDLEVDENHTYIANGLVTHNSRRGALMLICNDWHPDVIEFINSKREAGKITNANISVGVSDAFMDAVKADGDWDLVFPDTLHPTYDTEWNGDLETWQANGNPVVRYKTVKAREMWNQIIESAWASAEPGLWFRDRANKMSNSWYFNPLICTNPCVTADTLVYTAEGLRRVGDLFAEGKDVEVVVDGRHGYAPTTSQASHVFRTGRKEIFRLQTKEGYFVRATGDHRIMTERGWVEMQNLTTEDKVHILNRKGGFGTEGTQELGQVLGWLVGDGTIKEDRAVLSFFGQEKQELAGMFAQNVEAIVAPLTLTNRHYGVSPIEIKDRDEVRVASSRLRMVAEQHGLVADKHIVPESVFTGSEAMQRGFLQALFTADGSFQITSTGGGTVRLAANSLNVLEGVQQLLLNFGIASRIYRNRRVAGYRNMPDGKGGLKSYWCEAQHELAISKGNLITFANDISFIVSYKQEKLQAYLDTQLSKHPFRREFFTARVVSVTADGVEDVYDLTEPMTHSFIGNGITLHNCGEQSLPSFGICNLGAVNLARFVKDGEVEWEKLGQTVRYAVRFLDDVIDATPYFFEENAAQQGKERRVGLGVMGVAEMLIRLGLRYGSDEGNDFLDELFKFFASEAYRASAENAAEKGAFPAFDAEKFLQSGFMQNMPDDVRDTVREKGARNVTLLTVAPTGTTGTMVNTSTGVEPYYFWSYFRKSRLGTHEEVVDVVQAWRDENPNTELPDYFVTAMDLSPEAHVKVQAVVQKWIDSSISKTCNVPNHYTVEQTAELYQLMYDLGCKGGTIYRDGSRDEQVLNLKNDDKKAETPAAPVAAAPVLEAPRAAETPAAAISPNYTNRGDHKRKRARRLKGATYFVHTPVGKAFVTVNRNGDDDPFEVFANVGKVGSEGAAMSEALGRLVSLVLRLPSHIAPSERLEMVVEQLEGIGGARSVGFGANRVASLPDALAQVLREDLEAHRQDEAAILLGEADPEPHQLELLAVTAQADLCPECGHASFIRIEGCKKCVSCGHAEC